MSITEILDNEFYRLDNILSNCQTAFELMNKKNELNVFNIQYEIKAIKNALHNFEMSMRAERDKIREKEECMNLELSAMKKSYYENLMLDGQMFINEMERIGIADMKLVSAFSDGWHKCKKYYEIR